LAATMSILAAMIARVGTLSAASRNNKSLRDFTYHNIKPLFGVVFYCVIVFKHLHSHSY
jgi:hypothetical protein